jgi:hypothetical protein
LFKTFLPIVGYDLAPSDETGILLDKLNGIDSKYDCLLKSNNYSNSVMISFKQNECKIFSTVKYNLTIPVAEPVLYQKQIIDFTAITASLVNHWPFNNNFYDIKSQKYLFDPVSVSFTTDRLNKPGGALYLDKGYLSAPPGIYFNGVHTVSAWFKVSSNALALLVDFAGPNNINQVLLGISYGNGLSYGLNTDSSSGNSGHVFSSTAIKLNKWQFIAITFDGTQSRVYLDGILTKTASAVSPANVIRSFNYIGRSNWPPYLGSTAAIDDLKIFNRALTQSEIMFVMNSYH